MNPSPTHRTESALSVPDNQDAASGRPVSGSRSGRELQRGPTPPNAYYDVVESGCWEWNRHRNAQGYGGVRYNGQHTGAHRAFAAHYIGPIPAGAVVMHECDNPPCVNPAHLRIGTTGQNVRDAVSRGLHRGLGIGPDNPGTKLSNADVVRVFELRAAGWQQKHIAAEFGVSQPAIHKVLRRRSHGTVPVPAEYLEAIA